MFFRKSILAALAAGAAMLAPRAEEAVVDEGKINVRGQPSLIGEVVTQLQRGDKVTIQERIQIEHPKPGEPAIWAQIKLPANTPVWIFSPFVKEGVVTASRLNLRAGPGDNYSVIGRIEKGEKVKPIRTIEAWMEIEAPEEAYAFIDASLVKSSGGEAAAVTTIVPAAGAAIAAPAAEAKPEPVVSPVQSELAPALQQPPPAPVAAAPAAQVSQPIVAAPVAAAPVVQTPPPQAALPQVAKPVPQAESAPGKRLVRREGIVRATRSIQAPTWYELVNPETKVVINYLHEEKLGTKLKAFRGLKVVATGEEAIDSRWPNTPILELETLATAP